MAEEVDVQAQQVVELLDYLRRSRGFEFSGYKKAALTRRIEKRMSAVGASSVAEYQDYLEVNPLEFTELFNTILINVTSFFRDPPAWEHLAGDVLPTLLESVPPSQRLRIWCAGVASGEEAYTVAMLLAEALGAEEFKARVKIYATDLDDDALAAARVGVYSSDALKAIPTEFVAKYFEPNPRGLGFRPDLRGSIIFGRNDLISDAPISRIDLLVCRNVLIYFTPETQARILERFNFALNATGFLFLGRSEMLIAHGELFTAHNLKWRIFQKVPRGNLRERLSLVVPGAGDERVEHGAGIRAAAAAMAPVAQVVVDKRGFIVDANRIAHETLELTEADIGRPFHDLPLSYRPADLRTAIDSAYEKQTTIRLPGIDSSDAPGPPQVFDIDVAPLIAADGAPIGVSITFADVTALSRMSVDYERSGRELAVAYEELQSANEELETTIEELQSTNEELETTNEELQSTNEELETTNEELQSTNEELETMNEELQSTNDELEVMNTEANARALELDRLNLFFEGILGSLKVGVAVIDRNHKVQIWNAMSEDLWGLRAFEVEGEDFMALDIGLPVNELEDVIDRSFGGSTRQLDVRVDAVNRRGQKFECRVRVTPLRTVTGETYASMILATPDPAV
jgi:two-component system CheB/CheR fusion protein